MKEDDLITEAKEIKDIKTVQEGTFCSANSFWPLEGWRL